MAAALHEFEGEQLTVAEIMKRVPALGDTTIRRHLAAGRRTRSAMLSFDKSAQDSANGRKAARRFGHTPKSRK